MIRCNECSVVGCNSYKSTRYAKKCKAFRKVPLTKIPLLLHLLGDENKVNDTVRVLDAFDIKIIEVGRYPYFKLNYKE